MGINLDSLSKALTVASLAIAVFAAWKAIPLDADLKALEAQTKRLDLDLKAAEQKLKEADSNRKLTLDLYQEVKKVLEEKNHTARDEEALRVLIESLAEDPFRYKLLSVLAVGASAPEVKRSASESSSFYQEEAQLTQRDAARAPVQTTAPATSAGLGSVDVDIFYCIHRQDTSEPLARQVAALKLPSESGRWRIRALPQSVNQQPGYGISGSEIRFNMPDELAMATELQQRLKTAGIAANRRETLQPTKWYLSVFLCE